MQTKIMQLQDCSIDAIHSNEMYFISLRVYRGPNVKFENDELINRINCYCHLLNNIVEHMCAIEMVKSIIDKASSLVSYIRITGADLKPQLQKYTETR